MELNLHIIAGDLAQYAPEERIEEDYPVRRLRFPALFDGTETQPNLLYIVEAGLLTPENLEMITEGSSLLVIGKPPRALFKRPCNVIWVSASVALSKLFSQVATLFGTYDLWGEQLHTLLITKKRLSHLAEISLAIIRRPIHLVDSFLQVLFSVTGEDGAVPDASEHRLVIDNDDPALSILTLDRFSEGAYTRDEPFILDRRGRGSNSVGGSSGSSGGRTAGGAPGSGGSGGSGVAGGTGSGGALDRSALLSQNIFIGGHLVATLSFERGASPFTKRDYSLLLIMADFLKNGLTYREEWNTSAPRAVDGMIQLLLAGSQVSEARIDASLKAMAWHESDAYYCMVAVPDNPLYPSGLLAATAKRVAANSSQMIYAINQNTMVFIVNADQATLSQDEILEMMVAQLDHLETAIGVSNIFDGFHFLKEHYDLALVAQQLGSAHDLASQTSQANQTSQARNKYHRFEDHFMDYLILKCRESTSLSAVIPRGLVQLCRYDRQYGTNLVHVLAVFLRYDMRVAPAARELYLHRNTLTSKVSQIRFLTRMDFENDPEVRLSLMVALRMLGEL
jgi:hypothetical protein